MLVEYCHSMGNGPGDFEDYFQLISQHDIMCGGFVWEWCDHAINKGVAENGKTVYYYGGDHGEKVNDGNFCMDGLVYPDRRPHTALLEYKNVYRPARVVSYDSKNGKATLHNYMDFDDLKDFVDISYEVTADGIKVDSGNIAAISVAPHSEETVDLNIKIPAKGRVYLKVIYKLKKEMVLIPVGHVLGFDEILVENADGKNQTAQKWLESVKDNIAYGTYAGYKQVLESRIIPYFKGDKIAHIKTPHIEAFYRTLVDDYSAGTIKRFANVLNLIFKTAKRYSMIENNPCQDAQKPKRKDEDEGLKFFTPKQALMFMKSLDMSYEVTYKGHQRIDDTGKPYYVNEYTESYTVPTQYKVFFTLSLFCGFRKGETLALHWNDIDFKEKKISISKSVGMTENGFDYKEPKTKKSVRKVSIPDDVIPLLKQYHFEYIQTRFSHGTAWQGDLSNGGNLFIQADGKLMGHTTPYQYFTKHLHRYNEWVQNNPDKAKAEGLEELPIIPLHGLRHSCATLLNYLEVNIIEISKTLGHSTCSTTMNIYAHSFEEQQEEVATKVNEFLRLNA